MMISMKETLFSLSAALPYDPFHSKEISDIGIMNEYFVARLSDGTWIRYHLIQ